MQFLGFFFTGHTTGVGWVDPFLHVRAARAILRKGLLLMQPVAVNYIHPCPIQPPPPTPTLHDNAKRALLVVHVCPFPSCALYPVLPMPD